MPISIRNRSRLPSRLALLLGLGALSVASAKASTPGTMPSDHDRAVTPQQSAKEISGLLIWQDEGRIYVSEAGRLAEELRLGNTVEAAVLRQLLESQKATATSPYKMRDRILLVGGGGCGYAWDSERDSRDGNGTSATSSKSKK